MKRNIMNNGNYLTNMSQEISKHGLGKTLLVRREVIHLKHVFTELFVRRTIDIHKYLDKLGMTLDTYLQIITLVMRKIHNFERVYDIDPNKVVKEDRHRFFPMLNLVGWLDNIIVLDYDGVTTDPKFWELYKLCCQRGKVHICSANPTVSWSWFIHKDLPLPDDIHAMKGKKKKVKRLIELQKKYDNVFYIDNESVYLEYAWLFGIKTFHWTKNKIVNFSMNSK